MCISNLNANVSNTNCKETKYQNTFYEYKISNTKNIFDQFIYKTLKNILRMLNMKKYNAENDTVFAHFFATGTS